MSALAAQQGWSQAKQRTGGVACATSAAQAATIHASCLPFCITVAIPPCLLLSYAAGLDRVLEWAIPCLVFGLFDHSPGQTLRGERPAARRAAAETTRRLHQPFVAEPGFDDIGHLAGLIFKFFETFLVAIGVGAAGE